MPHLHEDGLGKNMGAGTPWLKNVAVIIPAWNEEASVGSIIQDVFDQYHDEQLSVIVVDDASQDQTSQIVRETRAEVITLAKHMGAWGAIQTGLRYALHKGAKFMVTMDADGQHDPISLGPLLHPVVERQADVSIGSFPARGSTSRHLSWHVFRGLSKLPVQDLTSGLKAYNRRAASLLLNPHIHLLEYQDLGTLLYLRKNGMKLVEVPVYMKARQSGRSRIFHSWKSVLKYLVLSTILCVAKYPVVSNQDMDSQ